MKRTVNKQLRLNHRDRAIAAAARPARLGQIVGGTHYSVPVRAAEYLRPFPADPNVIRANESVVPRHLLERGKPGRSC